jgi:NitT/TauT family transport system permease protein
LPQPVDPVMLSWMKHSHIIKSLSWAYDQFFFRPLGRFLNSFDKIRLPWSAFPFQKWQKPFGIFFFLMLFFVFYQNLFHLFFFFGSIPLLSWWVFFQHGLLSLFRILLALILATLLCVPLSVWLGVKPSRMRAARPILQLCASFPGSMLYVIFAVGLQAWGVSFHVTCVLLLFIGMQWYVLFNALGGVSQISSDLNAVLCMTKASYWATWKMLFIPSLLPSLMTGWITAMGAGWNALVLAEFLEFQKTLFFTPGLGSDIRKALAENDTQAFLASLLMMIFLILLMNRFFWTPLYRFVLNRYQYN